MPASFCTICMMLLRDGELQAPLGATIALPFHPLLPLCTKSHIPSGVSSGVSLCWRTVLNLDFKGPCLLSIQAVKCTFVPCFADLPPAFDEGQKGFIFLFEYTAFPCDSFFFSSVSENSLFWSSPLLLIHNDSICNVCFKNVTRTLISDGHGDTLVCISVQLCCCAFCGASGCVH